MSGADPAPMAHRNPRPADELIDVARLLVFVQGMVGFVAAFEVGVVAVATGGLLLPAFLLTAVGAVATLALASGIRRRRRRARTAVVTLQVFWLIGAAIDLLLAVFLARRGLEIVPLLTRIVLPVALFRVLRRPHVRAAFGAKPSRRRRRAARVQARKEEVERDAEPIGAPA
jgi:hypothetical protein